MLYNHWFPLLSTQLGLEGCSLLGRMVSKQQLKLPANSEKPPQRLVQR
jgi:hypothetical protein